MKPRARRVTLVAVALGGAVLGVLVVANWSTVRDHVEAWHFQLTRETETIEPIADAYGIRTYEYPTQEHLLYIAADQLRCPVIFDPQGAQSFLKEDSAAAVPIAGTVSGTICEILEKRGWRVLEQRIPRKAFVAILDESRFVWVNPPYPGIGILREENQ